VRAALLPAVVRFGELLAGLSLLIFATAGVFGLAVGSSFTRAISVGFYIFGSMILIGGFFVGSRGPLRPRGEGVFLLRPRSVRRATPAEREEALNMSAILVVLGLVLIVVGVVFDPRQKLF
jgi:hypothetical protein